MPAISARERLSSVAQDLRFAFRQFRRAPGFAAITVGIFALGIGASTAIFSVVNGVLLKPLPYPAANRIVQLWAVGSKGGHMQFSDPDFDDLAARNRSFAKLAEMTDGMVSVTGTTQPVRAREATVSREFFDVLGAHPVLGRAFVPQEQEPGGAPAAIVSYGFWQRNYGGSASVLGSVLHADGLAYTVVGVMPPSVDEPVGTELWTARELQERNTHRTAHNWQVVGRLRAGVSLGQAQRDASALATTLKQQYGSETDQANIAVIPLREQLVGATRPTLLILLAASLVLLLIACTNAVNLLIARMAARQGEIAVRAALGAGRGRLAQQFLAESLVLSLLGGALGVLLARVGVAALLAMQGGELPRAGDVGVDWRVLLFAFLLSLAGAVAMGLVGAWRGTRGNVRDALSESQRTVSGAGSSHRIRGALVVAQIAMTLALLVSAGLLARSFARLLSVDPGFRTAHAVVLDMVVTDQGDSAALRDRVRFYDDLLARVRQIPGVTAAGGVSTMPLSANGMSNGTFLVMTGPAEQVSLQNMHTLFSDPSRTGQAQFRVASAGYFRAMQIPLVRGRTFDDRDASDAPTNAAVISASLAAERWPHSDPIGQTIQFGNMDGDLRPFTIVGVVGDVREANLAAKPLPTFYVDYRQRPVHAWLFNVVIATRGDEVPVIAASRRIVRELRPDVPPRVRSIEAIVGTSLADRRFVLVLVGAFGAAALMLASLGVYGVISYLVTQRTRELGIRLALGAVASDITRLIVGQGARLAAIGIVIGAVLSLAVTRLLNGLLYGVSATDPLAFSAVIVLLAGVALLASWIPARRAARVPPSDVLRGG